MSNIKELIREKIDSFYAEYKAKFHQNGEPYNLGIIDGLDMAERILDTMPDEPVTDCNDLEKAAAKYDEEHMLENGCGVCHNIYDVTAEDAFIAGAEWQKRKMMDGAVEEEVQEVYRDDDGIHCCVSVGTDYKPGAIVYVITIPNDEDNDRTIV